MSVTKPFRTAPARLGRHSHEPRAPARRGTWLKVLGFAALVGLAIGVVTGTSGRRGPAGTPQVKSPARLVYYSGCNEVRAAGAAPLYASEPGYRPEMDGDGDGIACEPHRGR